VSAPAAHGPVPATVIGRPHDLRPPSTVRCFVLLLAIRAALRVLGFGRTHRIVLRLARGGAAAATGCLPVVNATAERVAMAAAFIPGRALCLEQSLALYLLLRRRGIQAALRLGVQAYPFAAHAWVEHAGEPVNESVEKLKPLIRLDVPPEGGR
jgi:hypothetical protein